MHSFFVSLLFIRSSFACLLLSLFSLLYVRFTDCFFREKVAVSEKRTVCLLLSPLPFFGGVS